MKGIRTGAVVRRPLDGPENDTTAKKYAGQGHGFALIELEGIAEPTPAQGECRDGTPLIDYRSNRARRSERFAAATRGSSGLCPR